MVDQLSHGRVDFGTAVRALRADGYGHRPPQHPDMWEESLTMIPKIWESDTCSSGRAGSGTCRPRQVLPKPYQKAPPTHLGGRPSARHLPTGSGKGHRGHGPGNQRPLGAGTPHPAVPGDDQGRQPGGATVNNQWLSSIFGYCGEDNSAAPGTVHPVPQDLLRPGASLRAGPAGRLRPGCWSSGVAYRNTWCRTSPVTST